MENDRIPFNRFWLSDHTLAGRFAMKRAAHLSIAGLAAVILLTGCLCRNPTINFSPDVLEPNDTQAQATVLLPATVLVATMNEGDAPDVFRFEAVQGETLRFDVDQLAGHDLDFDVQIDSPDGGSVTADLPEGFIPFPASLEYQATATGTYYLTLVGDYVGPPDALCIRGILEYQLEMTVLADAVNRRRELAALPVSSALSAGAASTAFSAASGLSALSAVAGRDSIGAEVYPQSRLCSTG